MDRLAKHPQQEKINEYALARNAHCFLLNFSQQNKEVLVPAEVPRTFKALKRFAAERFSPANGLADDDATLVEAHKQALETIRQMEETRLLEICSKTLAQAGGSGMTQEITQPFHLMSLNLLGALDRAGKRVEVIRSSEALDKELSPHRSKRSVHTLRTYELIISTANHINNLKTYVIYEIEAWILRSKSI